MLNRSLVGNMVFKQEKDLFQLVRLRNICKLLSTLLAVEACTPTKSISAAIPYYCSLLLRKNYFYGSFYVFLDSDAQRNKRNIVVEMVFLCFCYNANQPLYIVHLLLTLPTLFSPIYMEEELDFDLGEEQ
jgi:hypothetical protein